MKLTNIPLTHTLTDKETVSETHTHSDTHPRRLSHKDTQTLTESMI